MKLIREREEYQKLAGYEEIRDVAYKEGVGVEFEFLVSNIYIMGKCKGIETATEMLKKKEGKNG